MPRTWYNSRIVCGMLLVLVSSGARSLASAQSQREVVINGERLRPEKIQALEQQYRIPIQNGRYWYDQASGLWGIEGGPTAGQVLPGLALGGPLRANASGGATNVFFNGRALHPTEVAYLQACMQRFYGPYSQVIPGRYWMNGAMIGGMENGPPIFNLTLCQQAPSGGSGSVNSRFGTVTVGEGISSYTPPAGSIGVPGMSCGPDGGCISSGR
jgi:hypothetical protein